METPTLTALQKAKSKYYFKNKETIAAADKIYYQQNKEAIAKRRREQRILSKQITS